MGSVCWLAQQGAHINTNMGDNPEIWKAAAMQDHFEKIQKLPDKVDGVPNFRRVPGGKVSTPADQLKLNKSFVDYMSEHSKTLMRVLPANLKTEVEGLISSKTMTLD